MKDNPDPDEALLTQSTGLLLGRVRSVRTSVGDGLTDDELTRLLRETGVPTEAGFGFLSYADGVVTLTVPPQDPGDWYPERGWIQPSKESQARAIAAKYGLQLSEPPDESPGYRFPRDGALPTHHHLEFANSVESLIVAHPQYLKVRLFGASPEARYLWKGRAPVELGPGLLGDLAALYQT